MWMNVPWSKEPSLTCESALSPAAVNQILNGSQYSLFGVCARCGRLRGCDNSVPHHDSTRLFIWLVPPGACAAVLSLGSSAGQWVSSRSRHAAPRPC